MLFFFFAIIIKHTMKCDLVEVRQVVNLTWHLDLCFKGKPFLINHGIEKQKQPFKKLEILGGRGHQNTCWNGNSKGARGVGWGSRKNFHGGG